MNKRIRELAEQAEMSANCGDHVEVTLMMQTFADLIVQECLSIVHDELRYIINWETADSVTSSVKEHFSRENK